MYGAAGQCTKRLRGLLSGRDTHRPPEAWPRCVGEVAVNFTSAVKGVWIPKTRKCLYKKGLWEMLFFRQC